MTPIADPAVATPLPSGRRRRTRGVVPLALALVLTACGGVDAASSRSDDEDIGTEPMAQVEIVDGSPAEDAEPVADVAAPAPVADGSYAFNEVAADGITPVAYDSCLPIRYVTRSGAAPAAGERLLAEAVAMVAGATGLEFVHVGETDEGPSGDEGRELYQDRYGEDLAPVLIVWADEAEAPELGSHDDPGSETLGYASSDAVYATDDESDTAPTVYATGEVVLDAPDLAWELDDPEGAGPGYVRAVIAHELAHLVGLDHVDAPDELMHPTIDELRDFGPGDRAGLALLGQGGCHP